MNDCGNVFQTLISGTRPPPGLESHIELSRDTISLLCHDFSSFNVIGGLDLNCLLFKSTERYSVREQEETIAHPGSVCYPCLGCGSVEK